MKMHELLKIKQEQHYKSLLTGYKMEIAYPHVITKCKLNTRDTDQHKTFTDLQKAFEYRWEISPDYAAAHQQYVEYDGYRNSDVE